MKSYEKYLNKKGDFVLFEQDIESLEEFDLPNEFKNDIILEKCNIKSLKGSPEIAGYFKCYNCNLSTLKYGPKKVHTLDCSRNKLSSLEGCPEEMVVIYCDLNNIFSLKGLPKDMNGTLSCSYNKINSLEGIEEINRLRCLDISHNPINSLNYIPKEIGSLLCDKTNISFEELMNYCLNINDIGEIKTDYKFDFLNFIFADNEEKIKMIFDYYNTL